MRLDKKRTTTTTFTTTDNNKNIENNPINIYISRGKKSKKVKNMFQTTVIACKTLSHQAICIICKIYLNYQ